MKSTKMPLPIPATHALRTLGGDIRDARRLRRISTQLMAERAFISRTTLNKVEKGDPSVSMGTYATVLFVLGLEKRLAEVADIGSDIVGRGLMEDNLPQRIRHPRKGGA